MSYCTTTTAQHQRRMHWLLHVFGWDQLDATKRNDNFHLVNRIHVLWQQQKSFLWRFFICLSSWLSHRDAVMLWPSRNLRLQNLETDETWLAKKCNSVFIQWRAGVALLVYSQSSRRLHRNPFVVPVYYAVLLLRLPCATPQEPKGVVPLSSTASLHSKSLVFSADFQWCFWKKVFESWEFICRGSFSVVNTDVYALCNTARGTILYTNIL